MGGFQGIRFSLADLRFRFCGVGLACAVALLFSACSDFDPVPAPFTPEEISQFKARFETAQHNKDEAAINATIEDLYHRSTGLVLPPIAKSDVDDLQKPENISNAKWHALRCGLQKAASLVMPEDYFVFQGDQRLSAFLAQEDPELTSVVEDIIECGKAEGDRQSMAMQQAVDWVKSLETASGEELYAYALEYRNKPDASFAKEIFGSLLLMKASDKGHLPAEYDLAQQRLSEDDASHGQILLRNLAKKNYLPAQLDIAQRYRNGDHFEQDLVTAIYWYQQAGKNGGKEQAQEPLDALLPHLSSGEKNFLKWWTEKGLVP
jgi:TPR repeat protein